MPLFIIILQKLLLQSGWKFQWSVSIQYNDKLFSFFYRFFANWKKFSDLPGGDKRGWPLTSLFQMSSYSFRDRERRLYGYRSQPTSNRSSIHLSGLSSSGDREGYGSRGSSRVNLNADLDRQLKRLVERTEKFSNRVERLQTTSNYLSRGFGSSGESSS